jgi:hypothetical protein
MVVRRVIDDEIEDDPNASLLRLVCEVDEVSGRAISGIDAIIVGYVVPIIAIR